jgi:peptidyl-prolyl cis-trans isomerase C
MKRYFDIGCFVLFLAIAAAAGRTPILAAEAAPAPGPTAAAAGKVAATVNAAPIYEEKVRAEVEKSVAAFTRFGMRREQHPELLKQLRQKALDKLIGDELLIQESRKLKIANLEEDVEKELKALEAKHGNREKLEQFLKRRSTTWEDLKKVTRSRICLKEYLKQQGVAEPEIPEDRVRQMYDESDHTRQEMVQVSHILIAVAPHDDAQKAEKARKKADELRAEIVKGKDFAEMAKKHSNCNSASGGGDLGFVKKGFMPKEFDQAAFALEKGAVSPVVKTKFGYHMIKVLDKKPAGIIPYEEMRDFYRKYLQEGESKKKLEAHVAELRKKSKIEVLLK